MVHFLVEVERTVDWKRVDKILKMIHNILCTLYCTVFVDSQVVNEKFRLI